MGSSHHVLCAFHAPITLAHTRPLRRHRQLPRTNIAPSKTAHPVVPARPRKRVLTNQASRPAGARDLRVDPADNRHTYFATCARGLGEVLANELRSPHINAEVLHIASSGVHFRGNEDGHGTAYRACIWLRTATRVLHTLFTAQVYAHSEHELPNAVYDAIKTAADWRFLLRDGRSTFSVQVRASVASERLLRTRAKDAICDALRDAHSESLPDRPMRHGAADLPLFIALHADTLTLYADMTGDSLHKRGYRQDGGAVHRGALNETVAAGILYHAGFQPDGSYMRKDGTILEELALVDPMCGSGTLLLEAALLRAQMAVGLYRRASFPFERAPDFNSNAFNSARDSARDMAQTARPRRATAARRRHSRRLRLREAPALVVSNPPWGRRLDAGDAWHDLGMFLREEAPESTAVFLSGDAGVTRELRMKARKRVPVRIGNVDCRILVYDVLKKKVEKSGDAAGGDAAGGVAGDASVGDAVADVDSTVIGDFRQYSLLADAATASSLKRTSALDEDWIHRQGPAGGSTSPREPPAIRSGRSIAGTASALTFCQGQFHFQQWR
eukprot:IDg16636t1